jgi:hypothetical protein
MTSTHSNPPLRSSCADRATTQGAIRARRRQANHLRPFVGDLPVRVMRNCPPVPKSLWAASASRKISPIQPSSYRPQLKSADEIRELLARVK